MSEKAGALGREAPSNYPQLDSKDNEISTKGSWRVLDSFRHRNRNCVQEQLTFANTCDGNSRLHLEMLALGS